MDPAEAHRRVHRRHADRAPARPSASPTRCRPPSSATRELYYEDGYQELVEPRRADRRRARSATSPWVEVDNHDDLAQGAGDRVPVLTRLIPSPLVDRHPARARSTTWRAARRPADLDLRPGGGRRRRAAQGDRLARARCPSLPRGRLVPGRRTARSTPRSRSADAARRAPTTRSSASAAARPSTRPSTPRRASGCRWSRSPPTSRTTASARRSRRSTTRRASGSFGVPMPLAMVVDLDFVRDAPRVAGPLRHRRRGEQPLRVDGLAARQPRARRADRRPGAARSPAPRRRRCSAPRRDRGRRFLTVLAEAPRPFRACRCRSPGLPVRRAAATTRSCTPSTSFSPAPPTTASSPASARPSVSSCARTRGGSTQIVDCLRGHGLPVTAR